MLIAEPCVYIFFMFVVKSVWGKHYITNSTDSWVLLGLLGVIPIISLRNIAKSSKRCIETNRELFNFRQIKPFDMVVGDVLGESFISCFVLVVYLLIFSISGMNWQCGYWPKLTLLIILYASFLTGLSLTISVGCFFIAPFGRITSVMTKFLIVFSGGFYNVDMIAERWRTKMYFNPLYQYIELLRSCFRSSYQDSEYISEIYFAKTTIVILFLGLSIYKLAQDKISKSLERR